MKILHLAICSFLPALMLPATAQAMMVYTPPSNVPVWRLIRHEQAYLDNHRSDPKAWYNAGRIHYLALVTDSPMMRVYANTYEPYSDFDYVKAWKWQPLHSKIFQIRPSQRELIGHAVEARKDLEEAIRLSPNDGLYRLTLACMMEQFHTWEESVKPDPSTIPAELKEITTVTIRAHYYEAFTAAMKKDKSLEEVFEVTLSQEAGEDFLRLAKDRSAPLEAAEKAQVATVKRALAHFQTLPQIVTPVVFSFRPAAHLAELLAPGHAVDFDLRGEGARERWPWVKPETGFLVWDPHHLGRITSGREMFGNYTFQLIWKTGYDALAGLDDNFDGQLTGRELDGISVWFDRNGDGICTPDEVVPVRDLGITAIAARFESYDGIHPTNPRGIILRDGSVLRTWDWMAMPQGTRNATARHAISSATPALLFPK